MKIWGLVGSGRVLVDAPNTDNRRLQTLPKKRKPPGELLHVKGARFIIASSTPWKLIRNRYVKEVTNDVLWRAVNEHYSIMEPSPSHLNYTNYWLAAQPDIAFHDVRLPMKKHIKWAERVMKGPDVEHGVLTGDGVTLAIMDTGVDFSHPFFKHLPAPKQFVYTGLHDIGPLLKGQKSAYIKLAVVNDGITVEETDFDDCPRCHGTHVAAAATGNGFGVTTSKTGLLFVDLDQGDHPTLTLPALLEPLLETLYRGGARVFSNSWGSESNSYTMESMEVDSFCYFHDDALVIFSAGNSGPGTHTVGSPATAKNALAVGASQNHRLSFLTQKPEWFPQGVGSFGFLGSEENMADFSSRGPTADGRQKPDVVGPGEFTLSGRAHPNATEALFLYMRGTSMFTPLCAKMECQFREYVMKKHNHHPTSALMKAATVVMASPLRGRSVMMEWKNATFAGMPRRGRLHSEDQGWGRVNFAEDNFDRLLFRDRVVVQEFTPGWSECFEATVSGDIAVTIAWIDPPVVPHQSRALVNNLDLRLSVEEESVFLGNNMRDEVNNVEKLVAPVKKGERFRVTVNPVGPLTNLPPVKNTFFALALYPNNVKTIPCTRSELDAPTSCLIGTTLGALYNGSCIPPCAPDMFYLDNQCQCIAHAPCPDSFAFNPCRKGKFAGCPPPVPKKPKGRLRTDPSPLRRVLTQTEAKPTWPWFVGWVVVIGLGFLFFYIKRKSLK